MSLLPLVAGFIAVLVIALLVYEYYQQPLLAVGIAAVGFWVLLWSAWAAYDEWRR